MLEFRDIHKSRPRDGRRHKVLDGLSLNVSPGMITAIVGPSGCGKTTLIRLTNRLEDPDSGIILLDGRDVGDLAPLSLRRRVALVSQIPFMFEGSVLDNLNTPLLLQRRALLDAQSAQVAELLDICRISADLLSQDARKLSPGQQQRVSLARALVMEPEVLLLDEPTSALDRPTADRLTATLRSVAQRRGLTLLMVTHDLRLAQRCAERMAYLNEGRILEEGPVAELLESPRHESLRRFLCDSDKGEEDP